MTVVTGNPPRAKMRSLSALGHRDFVLFWSGQMVSVAGSWVQSTAQNWLVLELTNDPFKLGMVNTVRFLPVLLFSLFAGAFIDRMSKKWVIIITQALLLVQAGVMWLLTALGVVRYEHVLLLALMQGILQTVDVPARQSFLIEMVGRDDLMNAISLNSAIFNFGRIVGPALAGLIVMEWGTANAFLVNALSFVAVLAALFFIHPRYADKPHQSKNVFRDIGEGLGFIVKTPVVLSVIALIGLISTFVMNQNVFVPVLARNALHQNASGYGLLMTATGVGAMFGALTLAALSHSGPRRKLLFGCSTLLSVLSIAMLPVRSFYPALIMLVAMGWAMVTFTASCNTAVQISVPDYLRGRVMSVYNLVFSGLTTFGSLFAGWSTKQYGVSWAFAIAGTLGLLSVVGVLFWWSRIKTPPELAPANG